MSDTPERRPLLQRFVTRRAVITRTAIATAAILQAGVNVEAAYAALPTSSPDGSTPIVYGHLPGCFHDVWSEHVDDSAYWALDAAFTATLTPEQHRLYNELDNAAGGMRSEEQDIFVDELVRHLPAFGAVIRLVGYHVNGQDLAVVGVCCSDVEAQS